MHQSENDMVCRMTSKRIPKFNTKVYFQNISEIGKIDDVFGPINEVVRIAVLRIAVLRVAVLSLRFLCQCYFLFRHLCLSLLSLFSGLWCAAVIVTPHL